MRTAQRRCDRPILRKFNRSHTVLLVFFLTTMIIPDIHHLPAAFAYHGHNATNHHSDYQHEESAFPTTPSYQKPTISWLAKLGLDNKRDLSAIEKENFVKFKNCIACFDPHQQTLRSEFSRPLYAQCNGKVNPIDAEFMSCITQKFKNRMDAMTNYLGCETSCDFKKQPVSSQN